MELVGNSTAQTTITFLHQLRWNQPRPLLVIWDDVPADRGKAIREYLTTLRLNLQPVSLPAYSTDLNGGGAIWDWARDEVTANTFFGTQDKI